MQICQLQIFSFRQELKIQEQKLALIEAETCKSVLPNCFQHLAWSFKDKLLREKDK